MNSRFPRAVPERAQLKPCRQVKDAEIGLLFEVDLIDADSSFEPDCCYCLWKKLTRGLDFRKLLKTEATIRRRLVTLLAVTTAP